MAGVRSAWKWACGLAVAALPWLAGLAHPFLYDDVGMIIENRFLEEPANLGAVLSGRTLGDPAVVNGRRPAVLATYFLDRAWHGLRPPGWRATSLALHLGCVALAMALWRRLGAGEFAAWASGWLFAWHPALVEAVHAPGFRADVLCLFFMLSALLAFAAARERGGAGVALGAAFSALALLSKETALALPAALWAGMALFPAAFPAGRTKWAALGACAGTAALFFGLWAALPADLQAMGSSWNGETLRFPETVLSAPTLWARTLRWLLVPWPLSVAPHFAPVRSPFSPRFAAGVAALCGWIWGAWRCRRRAPAAALGMAWALCFFLPVSNLWPLLNPVADRYLYPIAPGFALAVGWGLGRIPGRGRWAGLALAAALYAALVAARVGEWRSDEALWTAAWQRQPRSATAAIWLGLAKEERGDREAARSLYAAAAAQNPHADRAWINWGILEAKEGRWEESERLLRRAAEVRPESVLAWRNLAACLAAQGRSDEAADAAARAAALERGQGRAKP